MIKIERSAGGAVVVLLPLLAGLLVGSAGAARAEGRGPCTGWPIQGGPRSDTTGLMNNNYPEASTTTYWVTELAAPLGSVLTIHGRFPLARFMALEIYTSDQLVDFIDDSAIVPDPGENNPYVSGTRNGTYTVYVVFGERPADAPPNAIFSGTLTSVRLLYRVYHSTDPFDPAGGATNPTLPALSLNGQPMATCPVQPFIDPEDLTPWGRLDNGPWLGKAPKKRLAVTNPPS